MAEKNAAEKNAAASLAVDDLTVGYRTGGVVLEEVSLKVPAGRIVTLVGPNGAGKTSLLRAVSGLLKHHEGAVHRGRVTLDDDVITGADASAVVRRGVAQVLEGRQVFPNLTVRENLLAGAHTLRRDDARREPAFEEILDLFPVLRRRLGQRAGFLSGGEQQMLAIGRALMTQPRLLVLDEPSLGLAPRIVEEIRDVVLAINAKGTTVLLVEQNALLAFQVAEYGYVLEGGRIVCGGPAAELAGDERVARYYMGGQDMSGRRARRTAERASR
ncbi:ABC transporter ATP-binding protein [Actinomadura geliboluensis]|jgi:branched-chain amino acid transport system ATP-binding protein|uniref:ABC transporter ATP-binding protein n=1 Tax=Actinomadura geliboluensis TaxID=882440 RepID=A0A5S4HKE2_9ACTN|nr:ABC transporter ATP-binding protein [Actinomadura geliboluensis]TMR42080.1 ABC transporter ATP-binding protein [Actinomadura geliboluensis]